MKRTLNLGKLILWWPWLLISVKRQKHLELALTWKNTPCWNLRQVAGIKNFTFIWKQSMVHFHFQFHWKVIPSPGNRGSWLKFSSSDYFCLCLCLCLCLCAGQVMPPPPQKSTKHWCQSIESSWRQTEWQLSLDSSHRKRHYLIAESAMPMHWNGSLSG